MAYIEILLATVIIALALVPAIDSLQTVMLGGRVYESATAQYYSALAKIEEVLAEQHTTLVAAAAMAGDAATPGKFSDPVGTPDRRLVFIGLYDADDADGDGNVYTVADPDLDGDGNTFTGYTGLVWIRVEVEGTVTYLESLSGP